MPPTWVPGSEVHYFAWLMSWALLLLYRPVKRLLTWSLVAGLLVLVVPVTSSVYMVFHAPVTTAFMLRDEYEPVYEPVPLADLGLNLAMVTVVHEDPANPVRGTFVRVGDEVVRYDRPATPGFLQRAGGTDWDRLLLRIRLFREHGVDPGGSTTMQQQLAKNLWLTPKQTAWRKGVAEPVLADIYGYLVPTEKQLEDYLNVAEFAPGVWGACAASWFFFRKPPTELSLLEAAGLVSVLPMPKYFTAKLHGGIQPVPVPKHYKYSSERLYDWGLDNIPPQVERDRMDIQLAKAGIDFGEPTGACATMPEDVLYRLFEGPTPTQSLTSLEKRILDERRGTAYAGYSCEALVRQALRESTEPPYLSMHRRCVEGGGYPQGDVGAHSAQLVIPWTRPHA